MSFIRHGLAVLYTAAHNFAADRASHHAAAVAYGALLALAPSLYLIGRVLAGLFPADAAGGTGELVSLLAPYVPAEATPILVPILDSLPRSNAIVAFAVPALVWLASAAFAALEIAFNTAFGTIPDMRFWLSRLKAALGVTGLGIVLASTLAVNQTIAWITRVQASLDLPPPLQRATAWLSWIALLGVTFLALMLLYKILPRGHVHWGAAAWAAFPALALWEGARHLFGGLLVRSPAFGLLTGVLAGTVAFLLWVYTAVAVTLFGAEVAAVINGNRPRRTLTTRHRVS